MKLLLDTHVFLWWLSDPKLLTPAAVSAIGDPQNRILISVAVLAIEVIHVEKTEQLPVHHRDPFDRMLVVQAIVEGATVVTRDPNISLYGVTVLTA